MQSGTAGGLSVERRGRAMWLRLDRPQQGNRVDLELAQRLCDAVAEIQLDDSLELVVLSSTAAPFCLGVENGGPWQDSFDWVAAVASLRCPVVAGVHGAAQAEGFEVALACDLRLASADATFALTQLAQGRLPRHGATQRLPRLLGVGRALALTLLGESVTAAQALDMGLVQQLSSDLDTDLTRFAEVLLDKAPWAARLAKEAVWASGDLTLAQGLSFEHDLYVLLQTTADRGEGVEAFRQRRPPQFRGR